jgi:transcriptional regulator with XRE-family HTH domain
MPTDEWNLARPVLPPRSRLYCLEPVGLGSPGVESLTSYVARLAEAHCVSTRRLVVAEVLPLLGRPYLLGPVNRGLSAFWQRDSAALNGTRRLAHDGVQVLEGLTLRHDLRFLTLVPWGEVLPAKDLLRPVRAWCPACYEEWGQAGQGIYDPLLWSLAVVTACPRHRQRLQQVCPHPDCQRSNPWLAQCARPGYCSHCQRWLGAASEPVGSSTLTEEEVSCQTWVVQAIGELLAAGPGLAMLPARQQMMQAISTCVEQVAGGNVTVFAREVALPVCTVANWRRGKSIPSLGLLLWLCHRLGTTPLRVLVGQEPMGQRITTGAAAFLGLPRRRPAARQRVDVAEVRRMLEAVLASEEHPPPPMRTIAHRLGRSHTVLLHYVPDLCQAISARYLAYHKAQWEQKKQQWCAEVRQATREIHGQRLYPSASRVALRLSQPGFIRDPQAMTAWRETLRELGWRSAEDGDPPIR